MVENVNSVCHVESSNGIDVLLDIDARNCNAGGVGPDAVFPISQIRSNLNYIKHGQYSLLWPSYSMFF